MSSLPEDIIINILTRLPLRSLIRFRCVCKSWSNNLFTNPNFVKLQFEHSLKHHNPGILIYHTDANICYVDYDSVSSAVSTQVIQIDFPVEYEKFQILDVCNGLIWYITEIQEIIIWNPFTNVHKKLPDPPESTRLKTKYPMILYGFGYDVKSEDYKFARIVNHQSRYSELGVFSFRANAWKIMVDIPFLYPFGQLVLLNGIFHWVESPSLDTGLPRVIASFDLVSETFKEIQIPQELLNRHKFSVLNLWLFESCLYLTGSMYMVGVEVWTMKQYGVKESWTKMFVIDGETFGGVRYIDLKNSLGNSVILVQRDHLYPYLYDLNKEEARKLEIDGIAPQFFTWAFLGSLISPTFGTCLEAQ